MPSTATVVLLLSYATLVGDGVVLLLLLILLLEVTGFKKRPCRLTSVLDRHGLPLLFVIALVATSGSLYFSEVAQWTPCKDCWFQRIFTYPQVPLLLVALVRKDRSIAPYILSLCLIGMVFSIDQYVGQIRTILLPALAGTCSDPVTNCNVTQIFKLGYVTIPMMALTAFALNALIAVRQMRRSGA
ncbi:MAG: disulfide bond formation protein B [Candidatus Peribacter sp.]|nr:disulfide bond formation protein B [Candidatus Peribacter sp.]